MKIFLPHSVWLGNIDPFLRSLDLSNPEELELTSNPQWTSLHPVVLSMVAALGMKVRSEKISHKIISKSGHYLERMGLFRLWGIESGMHIKAHEESGKFIPLTIVRTEKELSELLENIIPIFHLSEYPEQADTMRYIIDEVTRNVIEHAGLDTNALVCVQYYPRSKKIRIGIADTGLGLRATLSRHHHISSHLHAIQQALWPGITGTTSKPGGSEQNAGAGLFFTKSMARVNKDYFFIYSGDAMFKLLEPKENDRLSIPVDPFADRHTKEEGLPFWKGTAVGIDITLEQTLQFRVLLNALNDVMKEATRERRRKMERRKPRFI
ncbi:MAG: hypothetical protein PHX93_06125 [Candidatus Peribacteraceae bacterium]|nr:hypothetical protein [Candidatus Peribacteraceae bacterium]